MRYIVYEYHPFVAEVYRLKTPVAAFREREDAEAWAEAQKKRYAPDFGYFVKENARDSGEKKAEGP